MEKAGWLSMQTELMRQHAAHVERQRRLWSGIVKPKAANDSNPVDKSVEKMPEPEMPKLGAGLVMNRQPTWKIEPHGHDHHVIEWRIWLYENTETPRRYQKQRAIEMGTSAREINCGRRNRHIVIRRQILMYEIWKIFDLSFPQMGRLFGGRDHTTILHGVRKIADMIQRGDVQELIDAGIRAKFLT